MKGEIIETDELKIKHVKALVENGFATEFAKTKCGYTNVFHEVSLFWIE